MALLESGGVGASGLDLVRPELQVLEALRASNDVVLAPHVASATVQTRQAMAQRVLDNLGAFFAGPPLPSQAEAWRSLAMTDAALKPVTIRMHPDDNVAIVANDGLPAGTVLPDGLVLREKVPQATSWPWSTSRRAVRCAATTCRWATPGSPSLPAAGCTSG